MRVFRSTRAAARADLARVVATLGVFDGVHRGHQAVLQHVVQDARARGGDAVVVTFGRHPRAVIEGRAPKLLTALRHKLGIFAELGVTATLLLHFDTELRATAPDEFVRRIFVDTLRVEKVVLGYNNRFGRGGAGDFSLLSRLGCECGFEAVQEGELLADGKPLSSTIIRRAILNGDLQQAQAMLGRPVSVLGRVVRGDQRGRTLGFPTANLSLLHEVRPPPGVWGCEVMLGDTWHPGLVNIGVRPTVTPQLPVADDTWEARDARESVEVHLLDFEGDLYGRTLELRFLTPIRSEQRFASLDQLKGRITEDRAWFREWLLARSEAVDTPGRAT